MYIRDIVFVSCPTILFVFVCVCKHVCTCVCMYVVLIDCIFYLKGEVTEKSVFSLNMNYSNKRTKFKINVAMSQRDTPQVGACPSLPYMPAHSLPYILPLYRSPLAYTPKAPPCILPPFAFPHRTDVAIAQTLSFSFFKLYSYSVYIMK